MTTMRIGTGVAAAMVALVLVSDAVTAQTPFSAAAVDAAARALPQLRSLIVSRRGQVMVERYYGSAGADRPVNVKSAS